MDDRSIVGYLRERYNIPQPADARVGSSASCVQRRQQYCVIDFANDHDASDLLQRETGMVWPNGRYILVRPARHRNKPLGPNDRKRAREDCPLSSGVPSMSLHVRQRQILP